MRRAGRAASAHVGQDRRRIAQSAAQLGRARAISSRSSQCAWVSDSGLPRAPTMSLSADPGLQARSASPSPDRDAHRPSVCRTSAASRNRAAMPVPSPLIGEQTVCAAYGIRCVPAWHVRKVGAVEGWGAGAARRSWGRRGSKTAHDQAGAQGTVRQSGKAKRLGLCRGPMRDRSVARARALLPHGTPIWRI